MTRFSKFPAVRPDLPLLLTALIITVLAMSGWRASWLADVMALLTAFSIAQLSLLLSQRGVTFEHVAVRWIVLVMGLSVAVIAGSYLEIVFWPQTEVPHRPWFIPLLSLGFVGSTVLPKAMQLEAEHRAHFLLKREELRHQSEKQLLEVRLTALQAQIEPHFLYNTLANVRALVHQHADVAETLLNHLIVYLRTAIPDIRLTTTSLGKELDRAEAYLQILQIRMQRRLQFQIHADDLARRCLLPPLAVMTLVENAIKHGIEPKLAGGTITIHAHCDDAELTVEVLDDGAGFLSELGHGVGLVNLQERLQLTFGDAAELSLTPGISSGVLAKIRLPARMEGAV